jgi:hypothetical protein
MGERNPRTLYHLHKRKIHNEFYRYRQSIKPVHIQIPFPLILTKQHQTPSASYQQTETPCDSCSPSIRAFKQESTARASNQHSTLHSQSSSSASMPHNQQASHTNSSKPSTWNRNSNVHSMPRPPPPALVTEQRDYRHFPFPIEVNPYFQIPREKRNPIGPGMPRNPEAEAM